MRIIGLMLFLSTALGLVVFAIISWERGAIVESCWLLLLSVVPFRFLWGVIKKRDPAGETKHDLGPSSSD